MCCADHYDTNGKFQQGYGRSHYHEKNGLPKSSVLYGDPALKLSQKVEDTQALSIKRKARACKEAGIDPVLLRDEPPVEDLQRPAGNSSYSKEKGQYQEHIHIKRSFRKPSVIFFYYTTPAVRLQDCCLFLKAVV